MKAIPEITDKVGVTILLETERTCAFVRKGELWFANDTTDGGWYESQQLCDISGIFQPELQDALKFSDARAKDFITCEPPDRCYVPGDKASTGVRLVNPHGLEIKPHQEVMCMETSDGKQLAIRVCNPSSYRGHYHCIAKNGAIYNFADLATCIDAVHTNGTGLAMAAWVSSWGSGQLEMLTSDAITMLLKNFSSGSFFTPENSTFEEKHAALMETYADMHEGEEDE